MYGKDHDEYTELYGETLEEIEEREAADNNPELYGWTEYVDGNREPAYCHRQLRFDRGVWYCPDCRKTYTRVEFLRLIDAKEFKPRCLSTCRENYPDCRYSCPYNHYDPYED